MPIDYSKWDNLDVSSSEDEDDAPQPRVTRLDAPSSVTFGGKGGEISATAKTPSTSPHPSSKETPKSKTTKTSLPSSWTEHGGLLRAKSNSGEERNLYWSQDRYSVTLRLELGEGEKVKSVVVEGILPYADRWSAVGSTKAKLVCKSGEEVLLEGELPHAVHLAEEDLTVDWSVEDEQMYRFLVVTLHKAVPMQGLTVWWRRPLMSFPEADLTVIRGDDKSKQQGAASKEFLDAWEEAHKIFRESKQKKDRKA